MPRVRERCGGDGGGGGGDGLRLFKVRVASRRITGSGLISSNLRYLKSSMVVGTFSNIRLVSQEFTG